jgi:hypothetical protein
MRKSWFGKIKRLYLSFAETSGAGEVGITIYAIAVWLRVIKMNSDYTNHATL